MSARISGRLSTSPIPPLISERQSYLSTRSGLRNRQPMYPEVLHLSFLHTYGLLVAAAFLAALWVAGRLGREAGLNPESVTNLGIYCALAAIIGAKLMLLIVEPGDFFSWATLQAGGVFYGGLIAALIVGWWYIKKTKLPWFKTADVFAPAIALGHAIGRLGCFSAGCCWGV